MERVVDMASIWLLQVGMMHGAGQAGEWES